MAAWNTRKRELIGGLTGTVLEIGAGYGANFGYFRAGVEWLGLEPGARRRRRLARTAAAHGHRAEIIAAPAERIPLGDATVDAVVSTITLCSVADPGAVLAEIRRVLRPSGAFVYFEHVAPPSGTWAARLLRAWGPCSRHVGARCDPTRETWRAIDSAGFPYVDTRWYAGPAPLRVPLIGGIARA